MTKSSYIKAFTLIELLVVIAIVALLTGIILNNVTGSRAKSRDAKRISDLGHIQLALELFYDRCKAYPPTGSLVTTYDCPSISGVTLGAYISKIPRTPESTDYGYASNGTDYVLHTVLEGYNELIKDGRYPGVFSVTCDDGNDQVNDRDYCIGPK